jgi:hypothetical protein
MVPSTLMMATSITVPNGTAAMRLTKQQWPKGPRVLRIGGHFDLRCVGAVALGRACNKYGMLA